MQIGVLDVGFKPADPKPVELIIVADLYATDEPTGIEGIRAAYTPAAKTGTKLLLTGARSTLLFPPKPYPAFTPA
jgi:hypothetical protein